MLKKVVIMLGLYIAFDIEAFNITTKPICTVYTEQSILEKKEKFSPLFIKNKSRYATCSGVTWFHNNYVAALNLYGHRITTYKFDEDAQKFIIMQDINNQDGMQLDYPENLIVSPDGTLMIVCQDKGINIYAVDIVTHLINSVPLLHIPCKSLVHGVRFSSDGSYLALASFDDANALCIYKIVKNNDDLNITLVYKKQNPMKAMKPKSLIFTKDNNFVVVCYSARASTNKNTTMDHLLVTYTFDHTKGMLGDPIFCTKNSLVFCDDLAFSIDEHHLFINDQGSDLVAIFPFNPQTGQIGDNFEALKNQSELTFPHGLSVSSNGKYLAVANYGDDKFTVYQIT